LHNRKTTKRSDNCNQMKYGMTVLVWAAFDTVSFRCSQRQPHIGSTPSQDAFRNCPRRLRDGTSDCHAVGQGSPAAIFPLLIDLPAEVKTVTAEVVLLKPVLASFDVDTRKAGGE